MGASSFGSFQNLKELYLRATALLSASEVTWIIRLHFTSVRPRLRLSSSKSWAKSFKSIPSLTLKEMCMALTWPIWEGIFLTELGALSPLRASRTRSNSTTTLPKEINFTSRASSRPLLRRGRSVSRGSSPWEIASSSSF